MQLDLQTEGFTYQKWGAAQRCKSHDWLVNNQGDTYTIDEKIFAATYNKVSPGVYEKKTPVWAEPARTASTVRTPDGSIDYEPGDFLVFNDPEGKDGYAMTDEKFHSLYEPMDP